MAERRAVELSISEVWRGGVQCSYGVVQSGLVGRGTGVVPRGEAMA